MTLFLIGLAILIAGYFTYGKLVEKIFAPDDRQTPAVAMPLSCSASVITSARTRVQPRAFITEDRRYSELTETNFVMIQES